MSERFLERLLLLIQEDEELHEALVDLLKAETRARVALAEWRDRRNR